MARRRAAEARVVDVHRHQPPAILHLRREGERLAAAAGAVIGDHLARPRADEQRDELRPFVLRVHLTLEKAWDRAERTNAGQPDADRRIRRRLRRKAGRADGIERVVARRFQRVQAQVERRRLEECAQLGLDAVAKRRLKVRPRPLWALEARAQLMPSSSSGGDSASSHVACPP